MMPKTGTWADIERLVAACEDIFCYEPSDSLPPADDEAVMAGKDGDDNRLTFGMIRRAREAVNALR